MFSHLRARWHVGDEDLHDVKVCLYEALTNAFEHGNLEIPGEEKVRLLEISQQSWRDFLVERMQIQRYKDKKIRVSLKINDKMMEVKIKDEGRGFDPSQRSAEVDPEQLFRSSGRGLLLIQSLMDTMSFNEDGTEITIGKNRIQASKA
jgi:anti-sigma regulatory factor (Ser/Thr protein kinase)